MYVEEGKKKLDESYATAKKQFKYRFSKFWRSMRKLQLLTMVVTYFCRD
jgi:hypothetical protein